jgi:hypothetical protein
MWQAEKSRGKYVDRSVLAIEQVYHVGKWLGWAYMIIVGDVNRSRLDVAEVEWKHA